MLLNVIVFLIYTFIDNVLKKYHSIIKLYLTFTIQRYQKRASRISKTLFKKEYLF